MIIWNRTRTLIAGVSLILFTNAVALTGAAYNRAAPAESELKLSQRELGLPYNWGFSAENSGLALNLQWRVLGQESEYAIYSPYYRGGGAPAWLDKAKLAELGFNVSRPESTTRSGRHYDKQLAREVLLVLELDGSTYQAALQRARQHASQEEAARLANAGNNAYEQRSKNAQEQLEQEERENSRLFVIDAGLDLNMLRSKYADHTKYAIVRGQVQPRLIIDKHKSRLLGYISALSIDQITVPLNFRPAFTSLPPGRRKTTLPYEVSVAFGKRLEPWITGAQRR